MSARPSPRRLAAVALLAACVLAAAGFYWFRVRSAAPANLIGYLPAANASVIYIDVDALRRSGLLAIMAGTKSVEEPDYQHFVQETKFDYSHDLDAVAAAIQDGRIYFALRGTFHWSNLRDYALHQGGSCHDDYCALAGSQADRRISFYPLKSDVLAMAVGRDDFEAYKVTRQPVNAIPVTPPDPVWAMVPAAALQKMDVLPVAAKAYIPALQSAERIVFSIGADPTHQLQLGVHVTCKDPAAATALQTQFETVTKALRDVLARQRQTPDPADLSGVLVAGAFRREDRQVYGAWPIPKAFVDAITGNGR